MKMMYYSVMAQANSEKNSECSYQKSNSYKLQFLRGVDKVDINHGKSGGISRFNLLFQN